MTPAERRYIGALYYDGRPVELNWLRGAHDRDDETLRRLKKQGLVEQVWAVALTKKGMRVKEAMEDEDE